MVTKWSQRYIAFRTGERIELGQVHCEIKIPGTKDFHIAQINAKIAQMNLRLTYLEDPRSLDQIATHSGAIFLILEQIRSIQTTTKSTDHYRLAFSMK